jgi:hypothetical protein
MANLTVADVKLSLARGALHLQRVPREMFDLIPGKAREVDGRNGRFAVKDMSLAGEPGQHMLMIVYCDEADTTQPPTSEQHDRGGDEPPLRESEPTKLQVDALPIG